MTEFLVRRLIRDAQNTEDPSVREAYGRLAGIVGVVCNVLLFVGKFLDFFFIFALKPTPGG